MGDVKLFLRQCMILSTTEYIDTWASLFSAAVVFGGGSPKTGKCGQDSGY